MAPRVVRCIATTPVAIGLTTDKGRIGDSKAPQRLTHLGHSSGAEQIGDSGRVSSTQRRARFKRMLNQINKYEVISGPPPFGE